MKILRVLKVLWSLLEKLSWTSYFLFPIPMMPLSLSMEQEILSFIYNALHFSLFVIKTVNSSMP